MEQNSKGEPKKVDITVHIKYDPTKFPPEPPYEFWLSTEDNNVGGKKGHKLQFYNEINGTKYNGFDITFILKDETGKGFKFMDHLIKQDGEPDADCTPMWVKKVESFDEDCPDKQFWNQFKTEKVSANNTKLHVRNENDCKAKFKFALLFSRTPQTGPCEIMYDPDGTNGNGSKPIM